MKNLAKIFALTALAALIALSMTAMSLAGQPTDDSGGTVDADGAHGSDPLNGTWIYRPDTSSIIVFKLDNGAFESGGGKGGEYIPLFKGTYTTSGGEITMTPTHVPGYLAGELLGIDDPGEWYPMDELLQAAAKLGDNTLVDEDIVFTYSLDGNTLTMTVNGRSITYTRE